MEGEDAYHNHSGYNYYKHQTCHTFPRREKGARPPVAPLRTQRPRIGSLLRRIPLQRIDPSSYFPGCALPCFQSFCFSPGPAP